MSFLLQYWLFFFYGGWIIDPPALEDQSALSSTQLVKFRIEVLVISYEFLSTEDQTLREFCEVTPPGKMIHPGTNQNGQQRSTKQLPNLVAYKQMLPRAFSCKNKIQSSPSFVWPGFSLQELVLRQIISGLHSLVKGSGIGSSRPQWPQGSELMLWEGKGVELRSWRAQEPETRSWGRSRWSDFLEEFSRN